MLRLRISADMPAACLMGQSAHIRLENAGARRLSPPYRLQSVVYDCMGMSVSRQKISLSGSKTAQLELATHHAGAYRCMLEKGSVYDYLGLFRFPLRLPELGELLVLPEDIQPIDTPSLTQLTARRYRAKPAADLPHQWMGRGCIRIDDAAKLLGVKKDKIRELLNKRKTVYRNGLDWETLHGYEVDEYKFYNRVPTAAKGICIVYDSGMAKLRWELLGEGSPDMALPAAAEVPLLPAEVQEENEQLRFALEEIGKIAGKLGK